MSAQNKRNKRWRLGEAQNHRCAYCGIPTTDDPLADDGATLDEYQAQAHGGLRIWKNQIMACRLCNHGRGKLRAMVYFEAVQRLGRKKAAIWGRCQISTRPFKQAFARALYNESAGRAP